MRVWQKIYIATLFVSILFVNIGIYAVFELVYNKNIETEQVRGEVDYTAVCESIQSNMSAMYERGNMSDEAVADLIEIYKNKRRKQKMDIKLWKNGKQIYPDNGEKLPYSIGKDEMRIVIKGSRENKQIAAISELKEFGNTYHLYMEYPLSELNATWDGLYRIYIYISLAVSLVLALLLSVMLHFLLRPLRGLAAQVSSIGNGDYSSRMAVKGNDEFSVLGENINLMAETIEKNIETLKADNEKKEQLVDNLAHEMKSPLTSIYGFAEYVMNGKIGAEETVECCSFIMEESMRMKDMCYTLLDLSEIRHKKPAFDYFDAGDFFERAEHVIEMRQSGILTENRVSVEWEKGFGKGQKIYGNERLMEMLLINLVANAVRACKEQYDMGVRAGKLKAAGFDGDIKNTDAAKEKEELKVTVKINVTADSVSFCVQDNGIGIPREKLSHVTEPFYRVDKGRSRENGGNGLGLALCRQIVLLHGGSFEIKSEEGQGTEVLAIFTI